MPEMLRGLSILVVEDDDDLRELLRHVLSEHGADVTGAATIAEARGALRARMHDVMVTDLGLPDGHEAARLGSPSGLFGWIGTARRPPVAKGQEPIEVQLQMDKPNPGLTRLRVEVECRPVAGYAPRSLDGWKDRCDKVHTLLRQYLGA